jgi:hypothetical protein
VSLALVIACTLTTITEGVLLLFTISEEIPARAVLELVGGVSPAVGDGNGVVDAMQMRSASSNSWSATMCASRGDVEERLEMAAASGVVGKLETLQDSGLCSTVKSGGRLRWFGEVL